MFGFFFLRYCLTSLFFTAMLFLLFRIANAELGIRIIAVQAGFWASLIGLWVIDRWFRHFNFWVLVANMQHSRRRFLVASPVLFNVPLFLVAVLI